MTKTTNRHVPNSPSLSSQGNSISPSSSLEASPALAGKKAQNMHHTPELQSMDRDCTQDDDDETQDTESDTSTTDTMRLFDSSELPADDSENENSTSVLPEEMVPSLKITRHSALSIIKSVTGHLISRDDICKLLKSKFQISAKTLTPLTASELNEILARKLISNKYIVFKLQKSDITVVKEIEI
ncbi:uncharacterized protein LOC116292173 isoform X2 [Actinia tenebrosa]|nr:uncharacterized protein LOC116292173 isoform X2 [Actinia tenebrosa]